MNAALKSVCPVKGMSTFLQASKTEVFNSSRPLKIQYQVRDFTMAISSQVHDSYGHIHSGILSCITIPLLVHFSERSKILLIKARLALASNVATLVHLLAIFDHFHLMSLSFCGSCPFILTFFHSPLSLAIIVRPPVLLSLPHST